MIPDRKRERGGGVLIYRFGWRRRRRRGVEQREDRSAEGRESQPLD